MFLIVSLNWEELAVLIGGWSSRGKGLEKVCCSRKSSVESWCRQLCWESLKVTMSSWTREPKIATESTGARVRHYKSMPDPIQELGRSGQVSRIWDDFHEYR